LLIRILCTATDLLGFATNTCICQLWLHVEVDTRDIIGLP
jgi:hypothetical protein